MYMPAAGGGGGAPGIPPHMIASLLWLKRSDENVPTTKKNAVCRVSMPMFELLLFTEVSRLKRTGISWLSPRLVVPVPGPPIWFDRCYDAVCADRLPFTRPGLVFLQVLT
jgi:hypothetical protein